MAEEVLELSVEETNKLRAELGLKPLRVDNGPAAAPSASASNTNGVREGEEELLELSVNETNKLREKLGLAPLKSGGESSGSGRKEEIFQKTENLGEKEEAAKRIERAKLQREVQEGVSQVFGSSTLASDEAEDGDAALSWAAKMRQQKGTSSAATATGETKKKGKKTRSKKGRTSQKQDEEYGADDLAGVQVKNSMAQLEAGGETVLTLADTSILETKTSVSSKVVGLNEEEDALENVNLTEREKQQDGLRKKRMLEMGMGRAGGYAGFDDEEFEELGGTLGPSRQDRGGTHFNSNDYETENGEELKSRGFRIGSEKDALADAAMTDYDKVQSGKAVSLIGKADIAASDYMTIEEAEEEIKREVKFKKKKKKKDKKKRKRKTAVEDDDEEDDRAQSNPGSGNSLLAQLEQNAPSEESSGLKKRRRSSDVEDDDSPDAVSGTQPSDDVEKPQAKRAKYDEIMEKGNQRTRLAFGENKPVPKKEEPSIMEEEEDDSFLNAALAKARRLNRLRAMNKTAKGADAVVEAVNTTAVEENSTIQSSGTMSFSVDDTREFSRALRARTEQKQREAQRQTQAPDETQTDAPQVKTEPVADKEKEVQVEDVEEEEDVDMEELAKEVKADGTESGTLEGSTASKAGVGRGLSSFVSMLKTTGEIKGKHGGKEELRGRAKDERNYDNYEALDLSKVVKIGKNATDKDKEFANREIKLEYRDKHGRLLTQKAAYRELCYQFHGHGASKKNEEKRLKQIAREQAEARVASRQVAAARDGKTAGTTLGALKATQKATGKAFVVHKT